MILIITIMKKTFMLKWICNKKCSSLCVKKWQTKLKLKDSVPKYLQCEGLGMATFSNVSEIYSKLVLKIFCF